MDSNLMLQVTFLFVTLFANFFFILLPIKVIGSNLNEKNQRIINFCNSVSTGVFLGTCYLQLVPYVEDSFDDVFRRAHLDISISAVIAQCVIMLGFFLIVVVEQVAMSARSSAEPEKTPKRERRVSEQSNSEESVVYDSAHEADQTTALLDPPGEQAHAHARRNDSHYHVWRENDPAVPHSDPNISYRTAPSDHAHADAHAHAHGAIPGHGHSHIVDIVQEHRGFRCVLLLAALSCHTLFEGITLGLQDRVPNLINLFLGVLLHECLIAFAVGVSLAQQKLGGNLLVALVVTFSVMIPLGMIIGLVIGGFHGLGADFASVIIQALAAGTFVYVIFLESVPAELYNPNDKAVRFVLLLIGFFMILCLRLSLDDEH